jgi:hypothetical protein
VPTETEWLAEVSKTQGGNANSGGLTDRNSAYSLLKLTVGGLRSNKSTGPTFQQVGLAGHYWISTDRMDPDGFSLGIGFNPHQNGFQTNDMRKADALCVRCLKN